MSTKIAIVVGAGTGLGQVTAVTFHRAGLTAALVHMVRILDVELRPLGIRVNGVAPQIIATDKNKAMFPPEVLARAVEPQAIADVIAFLASEAAAPVSGAIVPTYG